MLLVYEKYTNFTDVITRNHAMKCFLFLLRGFLYRLKPR
nr:MAG TPA: hypothetical protein [Caudoviricetes sp.]